MCGTDCAAFSHNMEWVVERSAAFVMQARRLAPVLSLALLQATPVIVFTRSHGSYMRTYDFLSSRDVLLILLLRGSER